jgi:hypothetical protein
MPAPPSQFSVRSPAAAPPIQSDPRVEKYINLTYKQTPPSFRFQNNPETSTKPSSNLFKAPRHSTSSSLQTPQFAKPTPSSVLYTRQSNGKQTTHNAQSQSQFAPTPRFTLPSSSSSNTQRRGSLDDTDVEVEIQDSSPLALQHSPKLPSRSRHQRGLRKGRDLVEEVDEHEGNGVSVDEDDIRPDAKAKAGNALPSIEDASISHDPPTMTHKRKRKRRRLFYYSDSSSRSSSEAEPSPSPERESQSHLDVSYPPRFIFHPRTNPTVGPSLHSDTATSTTTVAKPSFILPPQGLGSANIDPSAFSPSHRDRRRRGGPRYLPDGLADTVRSWVLELAAQNASPLKNKGKLKAPDVSGEEWSGLRFRVAGVGQGKSGGAGAKCVRDGRGKSWLLVGSEMAVGGGRKDRIVEVGSLIAVRKGSVTWVVELPEEGNVPRTNEKEGKLCPWTVVLDWTVLQE